MKTDKTGLEQLIEWWIYSQEAERVHSGIAVMDKAQEFRAAEKSAMEKAQTHQDGGLREELVNVVKLKNVSSITKEEIMVCIENILSRHTTTEPSPQTQVQQLIRFAKDNGYGLAAEWMENLLFEAKQERR